MDVETTQQSFAENASTTSGDDIVSISPKTTPLQLVWLTIFSVIMLVLLLRTFNDALVRFYAPHVSVDSIVLAVLTTLVFLFGLLAVRFQYSNLIFHKIILTNNAVIDQRGPFFRTRTISRSSIVDCRVQVNEVIGLLRIENLGRTRLTEERTVQLLVQDGQPIEKIHVSASTEPDVTQLVSLLKGPHQID